MPGSTSLPRLALCLLLAGLAWQLGPAAPALRGALALFVLIGTLWMTQALPLAATALAVPLLAALAGLATLRELLAAFAHPVVFLFLGGFALAAALQQQGLDRALALAVLRLAGGRRGPSMLLLFGLTAGLSMWMSNTATVAMMLPLATGLLAERREGGRRDSPPGSPEDGPPAASAESSFLLLGLAYSASIGGIGTLVGSPPNAIAAAQAGIGFAEWLAFGLPLVAVLLPAMIALLWLMLRPALGGRLETPQEPFEWTGPRRWTLGVFLLTAALWVGGSTLGPAIGLDADFDSLVALAAVLALIGGGALGWSELERRTPWGVLLLFGGGLALSQVMGSSGASRFLADALLAGLQAAPPALLLLGVVAFVVFLTELVSNTATAALLVPVFLGVAGALGLPPPMLAAAVAASASCAFMLPVATPPNAIVFATGQVPAARMLRCGLALNLLCIAVIAALAAVVW